MVTRTGAAQAIPRGSTTTPKTSLMKPVVVPAKDLMRSPSAYPGYSFRSSLIQAQRSRPSLLSAPSSASRTGRAAIKPAASPQNAAGPAPIPAPRAIRLLDAGQGGRGMPTARPVDGPSKAALLPAASQGLAGAALVDAPPVTSADLTVPAGGVSPAATFGGARPLAIPDFPRPVGDNGRGMHWVPVTSSPREVVDRFVAQARDMKIKWMVILNDDAKIGENDYLVDQLVSSGIMPVMRVYTPNGAPIQADLQAMVRHYRQRGVNYYQLYNEPNLNVENPDGVPGVDKYLDKWLPAAKAVIAAGGLPGIGSLSPGGNFDDLEFLKQTLDRIKQRGEVATLDKAWLGLHNYTLNHPLDYEKDSNGFLKFKWYDAVVREKLGRQMPIIGTEGGTHVGVQQDRNYPQVDVMKQLSMVSDAYRHMKYREPYNFAYTYWLIANEEGGGQDPAFSNHALFRPDGESPLVAALKNLD